MAFSKLHSEILTSTIWTESHATRIVWITMLAMTDARGRVRASIPGLAHLARVTREECEHALERFTLPDRDSRTEDFEGKRIEKIDGGWQILNYLKYRETRDPDVRREQTRLAVRRHRERLANVSHVSQGKPRKAQAEAEAEAEEKSRGTARPLRGSRLPSDWEPSADLLEWARTTKPGINLEETVEHFRDYWRAKSGAGATKLDWSATFRNWVRNERTTTYAGDKPKPKMICTTCHKPITGSYTGSECDPCWKKRMGHGEARKPSGRT